MCITIDVPLVSALTTLTAVIVSPFVSLYIAKHQIQASILSPNRQKWIDSLRDQLAILIADIRAIGLHRKIELLSNEEYDDRLQKIILVETKVNLLLNPNEADHNALSVAIKTVREKIFSGNEIEKRLATTELLPNIILLTQTILKREWERVKVGK